VNLPKHIQDECRDLHKIDPETFAIETGKITFQDSAGVCVNLVYAEDFWSAPLKFTKPNRFEVFNSDPTLAHQACASKYCHHFIRGQLYKCHHVALLPEFMKQFHVEISQEDIELLESYQSMTADCTLEEIDQFVKTLGEVIPQCKLCPSSYQTHLIEATTQKIKIQKKIKIPVNLDQVVLASNK
jgi:hypothetical protein